MTDKRPITGRAIVPILLLAAGVASVVYGAMVHSVPVERNTVGKRMVWKERKEERELPFDAFLLPGPPDGPGFPDPGLGPSPAMPGLAPPSPFPGEPRRKVPVIVTYEEEEEFDIPVTEHEREPILVAEVTVGGVALTESGILQRTYGPRAGGIEIPRPILCPT